MLGRLSILVLGPANHCDRPVLLFMSGLLAWKVALGVRSFTAHDSVVLDMERGRIGIYDAYVALHCDITTKTDIAFHVEMRAIEQ